MVSGYINDSSRPGNEESIMMLDLDLTEEGLLDVSLGSASISFCLLALVAGELTSEGLSVARDLQANRHLCELSFFT